MARLTTQEQEVLDVFKSAGIDGRAFRSEEPCYAYFETTWKPGVDCPSHGRKVTPEACEWHREEQDPACVACSLGVGWSYYLPEIACNTAIPLRVGDYSSKTR